MEYKDRVVMVNKLVEYFNSLGIPAVTVNLYKGYLSIEIYKRSDIEKSLDIILERSSEILQYVKETYKEKRYQDEFNRYKWDKHSLKHVYSINDKHMEKLIRAAKKDIIEKINTSIDLEFIPRYVFAHSSSGFNYGPGYYIIFENGEILKRSETYVQENIIRICDETIKAMDTKGIYQLDLISIEFYNAHNCNLYGMSRED